MKQWYIASNDGKNFVVTTDINKLPENSTPAKISEESSKRVKKFLESQGCKVEIEE